MVRFGGIQGVKTVINIINKIRKVPGLGWTPNPEDSRDYSTESLGLHETRKRGNSLLPLLRVRVNQGSIPSCVGNAPIVPIMIRERIKGLTPEVPSRLFMYFNSRRMDDDPVTLSGTYIRSCFKMIQKLGVPDEKYWPYSTKTSTVNRRPGWGAYSQSYHRIGGKYYTIQSYGDERLYEIRQAIDSGYPVVFGTMVDKAFLSSKGPVEVTRPSNNIVGGHAMAITGYQIRDGKWYLEIVNSWGSGWRNNGTVFFHEDYIRWSRTHDLTIFRGWASIAER